MPRGLAITGLVTAAIIVLLFALDLVLKIPFSQPSFAFDLAMVVGGLILAYLSWSAMKEQS